MTPEEKARKLFNLYLNVGMGDGWAKECALIAVDEIINVTVGLTDFTDDFDYWKEVKQEIEKL